MNWPLLIICGIVLIVGIVFLVRQNLRDEKKLERQLKNDYRKPKEDGGDIEIDEKMK
jgi:hypothetical protein